MLVGLFITLTGKVITGAVIGVQPYNYLGLLGILVFLTGVFLIVAGEIGDLEEEVEVDYTSPVVFDLTKGLGGKEEGDRYLMRDPAHIFTEADRVSLKDVGELYEIVKEDPELLKRTRQVYGRMLFNVVLASGYDEDKRIARKFLNVIYEGEVPEINVSELEKLYGVEEIVEEPEMPILTKDEMKEIRRVFRPGWKGDFTQNQKEVLEKYDLGHGRTKGGSHLQVYSLENDRLKRTTGSTPSDWRVGRKFAKDLIEFIKGLRSSTE